MYEIALCDDDITFIESFEKMLSSVLDAKAISYHLTSFPGILPLKNAMAGGSNYDLIFLDIVFQKENGIHFAEFLRKQNLNTDIIFVSISPEYAVAGYDAAPLHYLLKPINSTKLEEALERFFTKNTSLDISFTTPKGILRLPLSDILYFEIYGHEITIHQTNGNKGTCTGTLKKLEKCLPPMTFVRPHRSYMINLDYISEITRYRIRLCSGETLPVSKNLYNKTQSLFIDYAGPKSILF